MEMTMQKAPPKWRKVLIAAGGGGAAGFLCARMLASLSERGVLGDIGPSVEIATLIGLIYIFVALALAVGVVSPALGARFLNVEDADELEEQRRLVGSSAASMAALGAAIVVIALGGPAGVIAAPVAFAVALVLFMLVVWIGVLQRRQADELMRNLSLETAAAAFYLVALVGGSWSILAHLGLAEAPAPIDWLSMFAGLMLAGAFISCARRGLLKPR